MTKPSQNITVIDAGINGLVAANYLARAGHRVTLLERSDRVGGACVSETAEVNGIWQITRELGRINQELGVDTIAAFESATLAVVDVEDYSPGFFQVYCEGAAMHQMGLNEPFDRLVVFFKNLALGQTGEQLSEVEDKVKEIILSYIANPEDCVWTRLLTPRDLQQTFGFPGGNIEHTMLVEGQSFFDRQYAQDANRRFYQFGAFEHVSICGSSTYPCGSVAGTPGYMCASELLRHMGQ